MQVSVPKADLYLGGADRVAGPVTEQDYTRKTHNSLLGLGYLIKCA